MSINRRRIIAAQATMLVVDGVLDAASSIYRYAVIMVVAFLTLDYLFFDDVP